MNLLSIVNRLVYIYPVDIWSKSIIWKLISFAYLTNFLNEATRKKIENISSDADFMNNLAVIFDERPRFIIKVFDIFIGPIQNIDNFHNIVN